VVAKIEDEQFWEKVHKRELVFGEGDLLKVRLVWEIQEKRHQLKQKNRLSESLKSWNAQRNCAWMLARTASKRNVEHAKFATCNDVRQMLGTAFLVCGLVQ
jgi:hypothetical protein